MAGSTLVYDGDMSGAAIATAINSLSGAIVVVGDGQQVIIVQPK